MPFGMGLDGGADAFAAGGILPEHLVALQALVWGFVIGGNGCEVLFGLVLPFEPLEVFGVETIAIFTNPALSGALFGGRRLRELGDLLFYDEGEKIGVVLGGKV